MGKKIINSLLMSVILIFSCVICIFIYKENYCTNWSELKKVEATDNYESFVYKDIDEYEKMCYIQELINFEYDFKIGKDTKIYINSEYMNNIENLFDLVSITTRVEEKIRQEKMTNDYGYKCTNLSTFRFNI